MVKKKPKGDAAEGSEGGEEGADADAPAKKKLPILIIAIAAGVLLLGGGGAGAFFLLQPKPAASAEHGEKKTEKPKKKKEGGEGKEKKSPDAGEIREGPNGVTYYTLPDLVANIQSSDGRPTFLKLKLTLEVSDAEAAEALEAEQPRIKDMFTAFLRELRPEDLNGSQGSEQLRAEILRRVNLIVAPAKVDAVLIEEMLVQ